MNAKRYAELKEMVIGMNNIEIINLMEILKEETEYRSWKQRNLKRKENLI